MRHLRTRVTTLALVAGLGILGVACDDDSDPTVDETTDGATDGETDMTDEPTDDMTSPAMTESPTG